MPPKFQSQFMPADKTNTPTPANNPITPKIARSYTFLIILTLLLILAGAYGYWHFSNPLPEEQPEAVAVVDKFAGWQTYKNEEYGFEFKYPNDWIVKHWQNDKTFYVCNPDLVFPCGPLPEGISADLLITILDGKVKFLNSTNNKLSNQISSTFKFIATSTSINIKDTMTGSGHFCNGPEYIKCPVGYSCKLKDKMIYSEGVCEIRPKEYSGACVSVVVPAKNIITGEIYTFPDPCSMPDGWEMIK